MECKLLSHSSSALWTCKQWNQVSRCPGGAAHLIPSRGLALITRTHGGTLPVRRHLLPVHYDSLALAMCCLFVCVCAYVCARERMRLGNRKRDWERDFSETQAGSKSKINSTGRAKASRAHLFYRYSAGLWRVCATTPQLMPPPPRTLAWRLQRGKLEKSRVGLQSLQL